MTLGAEDRRRHLLRYLYNNRLQPISRSAIVSELGYDYQAELDYLRDKGKVEFLYQEEEPSGLFYDVRITAAGIDDVERWNSVMAHNMTIDKRAKLRKEPSSKRIFIVHGRDNASKQELARVLQKMGLEPVILHEQPEKGRALIEKLEEHVSDVSYAFVLLTPDDIGSANLKRRRFKPRARQNVIFEFGYLMGKLGRSRICCLHTGDVEIPTDIGGIVYVPFRESVSEAFHKILEELKAAGYSPRV